MMEITAMAVPTPIPALAPAERPYVEEGDGPDPSADCVAVLVGVAMVVAELLR